MKLISKRGWIHFLLSEKLMNDLVHKIDKKFAGLPFSNSYKRIFAYL